MLWYYGKFEGLHLYTTEDVQCHTQTDVEREYGPTIRAAVEDIEQKRMICDTVILTTYQVLVIPKPRFDLALTTVFQIPHTIGDTVTTGDSPAKVR